MGKEFPPCEALIHADDCNGIGKTKDHFTPRCIAKQLGWNHKQIHSPENIQHLSEPCHREKDKDTPHRLDMVKRQKAGEFISMEEIEAYEKVVIEFEE